MTDLPVSRRHLLATAALTAGSVALTPAVAARRAAAATPQVTLPDRGIYDATAATAWTDGFLTGNGEYGAVLYGTPTLEKVIFNHHRFVLPNGSRGVTPPVISGRLAGVRDKALAGNYGGANTDFAAGWSLRWTQTYHPGFELQISTPGMTTVNNYARITDFRTGEVSLHLDRRQRHLDPPRLRLPGRQGRRARTDPGRRTVDRRDTERQHIPRRRPRHRSDSPPWPASSTAPVT